MKEGKDNINRKERKRERHVGGMEEGRVREKRKADKKEEGWKAGWQGIIEKEKRAHTVALHH